MSDWEAFDWEAFDWEASGWEASGWGAFVVFVMARGGKTLLPTIVSLALGLAEVSIQTADLYKF